MNKSQHNILLIDDHRLFADGLSVMLSQLDSSLSITTQYNARILLDDCSKLSHYDLILVDLEMPSLSGLDFLNAVVHRDSSFKVLIVSGSEKISDIESAMRLGASGFIPKHLPSAEMLIAIKQVLAGQRYLPRNLAERIDWSACRPNSAPKQKVTPNIATLRPRQLEVLKLIQDGHSNSIIGAILGISESAVKSHITILFKALHTHNRTAAVKAGIELGLI